MELLALQNIGLTKNESIVYLTLISMGTSGTGEILKQSGLNSGKIYEILESLKLKGLISESIIDKVRYFTAASSTKLLEYIESKKKALKNDEEEIKSAIPKLEKLRSTKEKETLAFTYNGLSGIKTAVEEAFSELKQGDEILSLGITERKDSKFLDFWNQFDKKRIEKKIRIKRIFSEKGEYFRNFQKNSEYSENKVIEKLSAATMEIYGQENVIIFSYAEPSSCILIKNRNIAKLLINYFELLWAAAKS